MDWAVWLALTFIVFAYEMFTLARKTDGWEPLTYYIRKLIQRPLLWLSFFGFWLWLGYHFFIEGR